MTQFRKLAIAGAVTALMMSATAAEAHVSYNTFTTTVASATDGWTRTYDGTDADSIATGPESQGNKGTLVPWLGTAGGALPFGYTGSSHLNWAAEIHSAGASLEVSAADAAADYSGALVEIDTGAGAWKDAGAPASTNPTTGAPVAAVAPTGWRHQTDIGVIKSHVTQNVTINLSTLGVPSPGLLVNDNFGVTVFTGIDTNTGNYSHHGSWNNATKPETNSNPFGTTGLTYLTHDATVDSVNGLTFTALADQIYTIYLGGNGVGRWSQNVSGYALKINTSPVPVPGAVWLFGSALAGFVGLRRRKMAA